MTERSSNFRPRREAARETPENLIVGRNAVREALRAARDMEKLLGAKVFLTTYVRVKEDWRDRPDLLRDYGYDPRKNS